ncbi:hypothetical protein [Alicyclobacillus contaminans]|uniref:hypothetical protein n=1 Tax=Alicyclobacillus contaminans TaxID=392016 RepID=UPI0012EB2CCB|nr:hypothetical protein [Alicyclobacillus contaminans]
MSESTKECKSCHKVYPATSEFFPAGRNYKGGLKPKCRACYNAEMRNRNKAKRLSEPRFNVKKHTVDTRPVPKLVGILIDEDRLAELEANVKKVQDTAPDDNIWAWRYRRDIGIALKEAAEWQKRYQDLLERAKGPRG